MAEGIRTEDGKRIWIVKGEDDVKGQAGRVKFLRPAEEDDVAGHRFRSGLTEDDDTEGQGWIRGWIQAEAEDDTVGHPRWNFISPEAIDAEQGLYLAVVDSEEDVTGQAFKRGVEPEDTEGQLRGRAVGESEEDAEGQVYRPRGGGEDGKGSV